MKPRDIIRVLLKEGWEVVRVNGSHHQLKHPGKPGSRITIALHNDDLAPGTLASIEKQAGRKFR